MTRAQKLLTLTVQREKQRQRVNRERRALHALDLQISAEVARELRAQERGGRRG